MLSSCDAVSVCVEPPINLWSPPGLVSLCLCLSSWGPRAAPGALPLVRRVVSQQTRLGLSEVAGWGQGHSHLLLPADGPGGLGRVTDLDTRALAPKIMTLRANTDISQAILSHDTLYLR